MFVSMFVFVAFIMACASAETPKGANEGHGQETQGPTVGGICFTPDADTDFFACNGIVQTTTATEGDAFAMALSQAKGKCAGKMKDVVKGMDREYRNLYASPRGADIASKIQQGYDHMIDSILENVKENCQEKDKYMDGNGRYRVFVGIKISKEKIQNEFKKEISNMVSKGEKMENDFKEKEYFELMDKRFEHYKTASKEEQEQYNAEHIQTINAQ